MSGFLCRGLALAGLLMVGLHARPVSAQDGSTGFLIPYQGRLELDGSAVTATIELRVGLFNTTTAGTGTCLEASSLAGCGLWSDVFTVEVHGGAFTVLMGSGTPIPDAVLANPELYVAVAVKHGAAWTRLQGLQRLLSTPYAVRARAAYDERVDRNLSVGGQASVTGAASVGGSLGVGTATPAKKLHVEGGELRVRASHDNGTPDLATFYANNLTQGVGIGYNRIEAVGSNAIQELSLVPRGGGAVHVEGPLLSRATRDTGGSVDTYEVSRQRFVVRAPYTAATPVHSYTEISETVLASYCGDEDGCRVTLRMRDWAGPSGSVGSRTAVSFSMHFHYGENVGGLRTWRREAVFGSSNVNIEFYNETATDNSNSYDHVLRNHDCYFTDALYSSTEQAVDKKLGMGLLNWNGGLGYQSTCELIIDD